MEKKFTRGMLCEEFKCKCRECPLHSDWNTYGKACWLLDEDEIQFIMNDYPYTDVKARMIFNDIETRLTAVEEKVEKKVTDGVEFTFKPGRIISGDFSIGVVDQKLYDKLQAKHEADSRLISEYDLENKKLKDQNAAQNDIVCDLYSNLHTEQKERIRCEAVIVDKNQQIDEWKKRYKELEYLYEKKNEESNNLEDRYRRYNADLKSRLFDLKNAENERDHYKGLYSSKCDDYAELSSRCKDLEEKLNDARVLSKMRESDYCLSQKVLETTKEKLKETEEKLNDARVLNKMREDVFEANIKLQKIIEAKDREIGLLRAELDKYTPDDDDECDID